MKWPWVSRARLEEAEADVRDWKSIADQQAEFLEAWEDRYSDLLAKYHELAMPKAQAAQAPVVIPEPESPPAAVLAAIQAISPTRDKTYEANWAFWERNKAKAAQHPDAFAEEIMQGAVHEPLGDLAEVDA